MNPPAPATRIGSLREIVAPMVFPSVAAQTRLDAASGSTESNDVDCRQRRPRPRAAANSRSRPCRLPFAPQGVERKVGELRPGRRDHDHVGALEQLGDGGSRLRESSELTRRRRQGDRVVDVDAVSRLSECAGERHAGALLDQTGVGLVGEAEDPDGVAVLEPRLDGPRESIGLGDVDRVGRLREERRRRRDRARARRTPCCRAGSTARRRRSPRGGTSRPIRVSSPSASVTASTSAPGSRSHMSANVFAYEIFIVTYVLTAIFVSSALTRLIRRNGGSFSQTPV